MRAFVCHAAAATTCFLLLVLLMGNTLLLPSAVADEQQLPREDVDSVGSHETSPTSTSLHRFGHDRHNGRPTSSSSDNNPRLQHSHQQQNNRTLLFGNALDRFKSVDFQNREDKFRCQRRFFQQDGSDNCICDEAGLRRAILTGGSKAICHDTSITVTRAINVTNTVFVLFCNYVCPRKRGRLRSSCDGVDNIDNLKSCQIRGNGTNRILFGAPISALFSDIDFAHGSAVKSQNDTGNGGVAQLIGGKTIFLKCTFTDNVADSFGGVVSAVGNGTVVDLRSSIIQRNRAVIGGAIYVSNGATVSVSATLSSNFAIVQGGAVFVTNGTVSIFGGTVFRNNTLANRQVNNIWIDDDAEPSMSMNGSNVTCVPSTSPNASSGGSSTLLPRVAFCGPVMAVEEFAGGPNNTQAFPNTNCNINGLLLDSTNKLCT